MKIIINYTVNHDNFLYYIILYYLGKHLIFKLLLSQKIIVSSHHVFKRRNKRP